MSSEPISAVSNSSDIDLTSSARPTLFRRAVLTAFADMTRGHLRMELPDGLVHEIGDHAEAL
jgi:hypothetical protein